MIKIYFKISFQEAVNTVMIYNTKHASSFVICDYLFFSTFCLFNYKYKTEDCITLANTYHLRGR
jgi:hypothetical protein